MKKLFAAVLFVAGLSGFAAANAADGCGVGCHSTFNGECVVDGWGLMPAGIRNECPVGAKATPRCPRGFVWKFRACFPN